MFGIIIVCLCLCVFSFYLGRLYGDQVTSTLRQLFFRPRKRTEEELRAEIVRVRLETTGSAKVVAEPETLKPPPPLPMPPKPPTREEVARHDAELFDRFGGFAAIDRREMADRRQTPWPGNRTEMPPAAVRVQPSNSDTRPALKVEPEGRVEEAEPGLAVNTPLPGLRIEPTVHDTPAGGVDTV